MKLISYGNGDEFDLSMWNEVKNSYSKPHGGLWTSPIDSKYGWKNWCQDNEFGDLSTSFQLEIKGNVFTITNIDDLKNMPTIKLCETWFYSIDFELMKKNGIDAIYLTDIGEVKTRYVLWYDANISFYGWDCETVFIMNKDCVIT